MKLQALLLAALYFAAPAFGAGDDEEHNHPWEWAATFEMPTEGKSTWIFQPVDGEYADPAMLLCWYPVATNDEEGLESVEEQAEECYNRTGADINQAFAGATLAPDTLYNLNFSPESYTTPFLVGPFAEGSENAAFFLQHFPYEFENNIHWLQSYAGEDVEPGFEEPPRFEAPEDQGLAFVAAFIVAFVSFSGVVLVNAGVVGACGGIQRFTNSAGAFASGVLIYAAFSLLLPEGLYLLGEKEGINNDEGYTENQINAFYASSVVIGVALCILLDVFFEHKATDKILENKDTEEEEQISKAGLFDFSLVEPLSWQIVIGDFFHNFVDGIVIGAAFMSCAEGAGWTVTVSTILHEVVQEVADFMVLTTDGKMSFAQAAFWNFISSLGVVVGTLIVVLSEPSGPVQGCLMAFGASFYIYVATAQLQWWKAKADLARNAALYVFGCVLIGLVLIFHEHCDEGGEGHAHGHE